MANLARSSMSKTDLIVLFVFVLGFVLFLYGAKFYDATVGYAGIYLFIGAIAAYLIIYIYKELTKKTPSTC
jgi:multisubunit Na+/H+ antiporter MnhB subunit